MPTMLPAMRGHFGSTEFFIITMPAKELERTLTIPKKLDDWDNMTLEERFQRDVNYTRVKQHIAPYLANDPDRFFGAFIVDIYNGDNVEFQPLGDVVKSIPKLYESSLNSFGFLYLQGDEVFVPLDGQHRLTAIQFAISGKDEKGKEISNLQPNMSVASDICTCILVRHETEKARKIFNKVNRYAKATTKSDNLITADDDIIAVTTRELVHKCFNDRIVNYKSNTLSRTAPEFTTLSTLYEATGAVAESTIGLNRKIDRTVLPPTAEQKVIKEICNKFWDGFVAKIKVMNAPLIDPSEDGDDKRRQFRADYILGKPIVQFALVEAILRLREEAPDGSRLSEDEVYGRINKCDWGVSNMHWQRVIMVGDKVITGQQARRFAARFLAYYLGEKLDSVELNQLREQYQDLFDEKGKELPTPAA